MISFTVRVRRNTTLIILFAAPAILLLSISCRTSPPIQPSPIQPALAKNEFLGNDACQECHRAEFNTHLHSRHAIALRTMDRESLGSQAPAPGRLGDSGYELTESGSGYEFGLAGGRTFPLQLVFGSGKSGMAFSAIPADGVLAEARMSYYPPSKKWFITPGQQVISGNSLGNMTRGEPARQCLGCHTVTLPENALMPERKYMGVGCESCHGAGGAHVAAAREGSKTDLKMERLGASGGARLTEVCGRCHRTEKDVITKSLSKEHTDLFQAHGLAQSKCFQLSKDQLSCVTCHDPHTNASTNENSYTMTCLKCHGSASLNKAPQTIEAKSCPVNPKERCTGCHMPKLNESLFPGQPRRVADHYIRVRR